MSRWLALGMWLWFLIGCNPYPPDQIQKTIATARQATAHIISGPKSCTAFHIGKGRYISAAHCIDGPIILIYNLKAYDTRDVQAFASGDIAIFSSIAIPEHLAWATSAELKNIVGTPILVLGFPGYFSTQFSFEVSRMLGDGHFNDQKVLVATSAIYMGESGGPVISINSGHVLGVATALIEKIESLDEDIHMHKTLSIIVPSSTVVKILAEISHH